MRSITLPLSLGSLAIWLAITLGLGGTRQSLDDAASGIGLPWLLAALFATAVVLISKDRHEVGLGLPATLRPVVPPLLYTALLLLLAWISGMPPRAMVLMVAVNTALVAISEELMFRAIVLQGFLSRYPLLPAVLLSSLLFGLAHAANGFATGDLGGALWQSGAAALQGVGYAAIRIRTRSIWPMVVIHGLWDFSLMTATLAAAADGETTILPFAALVAVLPLCLYGLYLLRGSHAAPTAVPSTSH
jgi:hypothetical protein